MDAPTLLALAAVITAGQVASVAVFAVTYRRLATLAIHSALAATPQEYAMLSKSVQKPAKRKPKPTPPIPYGL